MYIYYKYAPYGSKLVVLSYVDDCIFWYTYEELGKWLMDTLEKRFHANFLGYVHWFMYITTSQLKDYSISVDQSRYTTAVTSKYLDTATIKENKKFHNTTLTHDMVFTKEDASNSDEKLEVLSLYYNIQYRYCVVPLIYFYLKEWICVLQYTSWRSFHQIMVKYILRVWYIF